LAEITIIGLHYAYPPWRDGAAPHAVLKGIDLDIEPGTFVSIMGPTGVGKTTLCLALNGTVPQATGGVFRGDVWVRGLNTKEATVPALAAQVGIVFQDAESQFLTMAVEDEVAFGPEGLGLPRDEIARRVEWALDAVHISGYRRRSLSHLSGGQKQRVAIASILAMQPRILVLDEPTSGLDPVGKQEVFEVVHDLKHRYEATIILVEQDAEKVAAFADRVIVLHDGVVAMDGHPRDVFADPAALTSLGIGTPQVSELAGSLNDTHGTHHSFLTLDGAAATLRATLQGQT
jgi:energy-coupling factor transporter ATP-binding protein EcfA2